MTGGHHDTRLRLYEVIGVRVVDSEGIRKDFHDARSFDVNQSGVLQIKNPEKTTLAPGAWLAAELIIDPETK